MKANCSVIFKVQNLVGKKAVKSNTKPDDKNSGKRSYTLANCQRKPKKNRCVISCLHMSVIVDSSEKWKPEPIKFYNKTEYGV